MSEEHDVPGEEGADAPRNFIRTMIDEDLASGKYQGVVTRFPPEPNGYLHIGHAKSICLNFGLARDYDGRCHLRFDDTNPVKEDVEYVESIQEDIRWLGFDWGEHLYFASDYFEKMYAWAEGLIEDGLAYVDSQPAEVISAQRGELGKPGVESPYRERSVEENLDLFRRMRAGEFAEGEHVLRAKADMTSPNMLMRDPLLYRIKHAEHHRTGDAWVIYPMYDYAHCLEDAIEDITHSLCTLEFDNNRELYDWVLDAVGFERPRTEQTEFARLKLEYTVMSKRKLLRLVEEGHVSGWDDPRMPTIAGLRRRGYTPESIQSFAEMIGVAKSNSMVDIGKLEYSIRDDLNARAPRRFCVTEPLKVTVTNLAAGEEVALTVDEWPAEIGKEGSREVPFTRELYIERGDFALEPPKGWRRLTPGGEVRLRGAFFLKCEEVVTDEGGEVTELRCTYDPETLGGKAPDGRKPDGTIHWVSASRGVPCELRLYDRLFTQPEPESDPERDFIAFLNPESLVVRHGVIEPSVEGAEAGSRYQFERLGYFMVDPVDSGDGGLVFNRVVTLKDGWAKKVARAAGAPERKEKTVKVKSARAQRRPERRSREDEREAARAENAEWAARYARYTGELGVSEENADILSVDDELAGFFEAALGAHDAPQSVANWVVNELLRELKEAELDELALTPTALGELVGLLDAGEVTQTGAKAVFEVLLAEGGEAAEVVDRLGVRSIEDSSVLEAAVDGVLAANPDEVASYRAGKKALVGFFIGQVMQATRGRADAKEARAMLMSKLDA
jgi:glutaminyl-tRNA synthetase